MNEVIFIRRNSIQEAQKLVENAPAEANFYGPHHYLQWDGRILKTLVEDAWRATATYGGNQRFVDDCCVSLKELEKVLGSIERIKESGGIQNAKDRLKMNAVLRWINPEIEQLKEDVDFWDAIHEQ
ncbi:hypothetical protein ACEPOF_000413 [Acinetobacter baumannii]